MQFRGRLNLTRVIALSFQAFGAAIIALGLASCAQVGEPPKRVSSPQLPSSAAQEALKPQVPTLKRKVAVGRFSNTTNYGKGLLYDGENDPLAGQAHDMLVKRLVETGRFIVLERSDLNLLTTERSIIDDVEMQDLVGVDALIIGSVTEFGRKTEGQAGFLSSTKKQVASATVEARLVNPRTGAAFFSASGRGTAALESGEIAGFGSRAAYDSTLNDRAIGSAVSDLTSALVSNLQDRPWTTDVLKIDGNTAFISGGEGQGIKLGEQFSVESEGETVKSGQSGMPITLPGRQVAIVQVMSFFGDDEYNEGSVVRVVSGSLSGYRRQSLIVKEAGA